MRLDAGALPPTAREGLSFIPRDFFAAERTRVEDRLLGASLLGSSSSSSNRVEDRLPGGAITRLILIILKKTGVEDHLPGGASTAPHRP